MTGIPWKLSQISEKARVKHDRIGAELAACSGAVTYTSTSDTPCPYCGILMSDRDGRDRLRGIA
jgi:hypothetical protein